jgi:hypothetical protein
MFFRDNVGSMLINGLYSAINYPSYLIYAEDDAIYRVIKSLENRNILQSDINSIQG